MAETESGYRLEAPGVDYELKLVLLNIAQELTYKNIVEIKFLLHGKYLISTSISNKHATVISVIEVGLISVEFN